MEVAGADVNCGQIDDLTMDIYNKSNNILNLYTTDQTMQIAVIYNYIFYVLMTKTTQVASI